jgi:hypothetical protein
LTDSEPFSVPVLALAGSVAKIGRLMQHAALAIGAIAMLPAVADSAKTAMPGMEIEFHQGRVTVNAAGVPLADLLGAIGEKAGFELMVYGDLGNIITPVQLVDVPLIEGIRYLAGDHSIILVYPDAEERGANLIKTQLRIYGNTPDSSIQATPDHAPRHPPHRDTSIERANEATTAKDRLLVDLDQVDAAARIQAINSLISLESATAITLLTQILRQDVDAAVRLHAVGLLESIGGEAATNALEKGLGDRDPAVRSRIVTAFGLTGGERTLPILGQTLLSDPDPTVRQAALHAMTLQPRNEAVWAFLKVAAQDRDSQVRDMAMAALGQ